MIKAVFQQPAKSYQALLSLSSDCAGNAVERVRTPAKSRRGVIVDTQSMVRRLICNDDSKRTASAVGHCGLKSLMIPGSCWRNRWECSQQAQACCSASGYALGPLLRSVQDSPPDCLERTTVGLIPNARSKRRRPRPCGLRRLRLERVMGIEPTYRAWEASVLPLNYTR
jgi:hypothetical protein